MPKRTSPLTDAIIKGVDRYMELIEELTSGDKDISMLEIKVDQRELRKRYDETIGSEAAVQAFIAEYGEEEYAKQTLLHYSRSQNAD